MVKNRQKIFPEKSTKNQSWNIDQKVILEKSTKTDLEKSIWKQIYKMRQARRIEQNVFPLIYGVPRQDVLCSVFTLPRR